MADAGKRDETIHQRASRNLRNWRGSHKGWFAGIVLSPGLFGALAHFFKPWPLCMIGDDFLGIAGAFIGAVLSYGVFYLVFFFRAPQELISQARYQRDALAAQIHGHGSQANQSRADFMRFATQCETRKHHIDGIEPFALAESLARMTLERLGETEAGRLRVDFHHLFDRRSLSNRAGIIIYMDALAAAARNLADRCGAQRP